MTFDDIVSHFGSVAKAKEALNLQSRQTLYNWRQDGVPDGEQCRIQILTGGQLKADAEAVAGRRTKTKQHLLPLEQVGE